MLSFLLSEANANDNSSPTVGYMTTITTEDEHVTAGEQHENAAVNIDDAYANDDTAVKNVGPEYAEIGAANNEPEYAYAETNIRVKHTFADEKAPEYVNSHIVGKI